MAMAIEILLITCFLLNKFQATPLEVKIEEYQRFAISNFYKCGQTVKLESQSCTCDCDANKAKLDHSENNPFNDPARCGQGNFCFVVESKQLSIPDQICGLHGLCSFRLIPKITYQILVLTDPKSFYQIMILNNNGTIEEINMPSEYTMLTYRNTTIRIHDASFPSTEKWTQLLLQNANSSDKIEQIWKTDETLVNTYNEVNVSKSCWFQPQNEIAIVEAIRSMNPLEDGVCSGDVYDLNILKKQNSIKGLNKEIQLPYSSSIDRNKVVMAENNVEFHYGLKDWNNSKPEIRFVKDVFIKDDKLFVKLLPFTSAGKYLTNVKVLDKTGQVLTKNFEAFCNGIYKFSYVSAVTMGHARLEVAVCFKELRTGNWCEIIESNDMTQNGWQEILECLYPTSTSTVFSEEPSLPPNSEEPSPPPNSEETSLPPKFENSEEFSTSVFNSNDNEIKTKDDVKTKDDIRKALIGVLFGVVILIVFAFGSMHVYHRRQNLKTKSNESTFELKSRIESSETVNILQDDN